MFVDPTENFPVVFGSLNTGSIVGTIKLIPANNKSPVIRKTLMFYLRTLVEFLIAENNAINQRK